MKRLRLIGLLGMMLFIVAVACSTKVSAMERHAMFFEKEIPDSMGNTSTYMAPKDHEIATAEFSPSIYTKSSVLDSTYSWQKIVESMNTTFGNSSDNDINYLIINGHGYSSGSGTRYFTYKQLKNTLDQYKGHFVLVFNMCYSGASIEKASLELKMTFGLENKKGEFKNTKYNVYCCCSQTEKGSYDRNGFSHFIKCYFDSSKINENGYLNADYNHDNIVTAAELEQYLSIYGKQTVSGNLVTPVAQVINPNLELFTIEGRNHYNISQYSCYYKKHNLTAGKIFQEPVGLAPFHCLKKEKLKFVDNNSSSDSLFIYDFPGGSHLVDNHQFIIHPTDKAGYFAISTVDNKRWILPSYPGKGAKITYTDSRTFAGIWKLIVQEGKDAQSLFSFDFVGYNDKDKNYEGEHLTLDVTQHKEDNLTPLVLWTRYDNYDHQKFGIFSPELFLSPDEIKTSLYICSAQSLTKCLYAPDSLEDVIIWDKVPCDAFNVNGSRFVLHPIVSDPNIVRISTVEETDNRWLCARDCCSGSSIIMTPDECEAGYWKIIPLFHSNKVVLHYMGNDYSNLNDTQLSLNISGGLAMKQARLILYPSGYDDCTNQQFEFD